MTSARRGAIVGFGNVAEKGHLPGWLAAKDFDIVAVADPSPARRALATELIRGVRVYSEPEELFRNEALDFVDIASPPAFHAAAILAAVRAGVDVLCEKPLTTSVAEYRPVRRAINGSGVLLHVVHNWKYSEAFIALHQVLAGASIGTIRRVLFETRRNGWSVSDGDWRIEPSIAGGGILVDHGWHNFYLILTLAGAAPTSVGATLEKRRYRDAAIEDTATCHIKFPQLTAEVRLTWAASERHTRWEVQGERGRVILDEDVLHIECVGRRESHPLRTSLSAGSHHADWFPGVIDSFRNELDHAEHRGTNRREAEWCLVLLDQAYAAAASGTRLKLLELDALLG